MSRIEGVALELVPGALLIRFKESRSRVSVEVDSTLEAAVAIAIKSEQAARDLSRSTFGIGYVDALALPEFSTRASLVALWEDRRELVDLLSSIECDLADGRIDDARVILRLRREGRR